MRRKFHERFLTILAEHCPNLKQKETIFVADREPGITNAIAEKLPSANILHCRNHIKRDVREWLRKRKAPTSNVDVYMENLDRLLRCESEEEFHHEFDSLSSSWSAFAFAELF